MSKFQIAALTLFSIAAHAQGRPDTAKRIAGQREAMKPLAYMDGVWRGPAWTLLPSGDKHTITQTERIGPFLDGGVKLLEGRGYESDGKATFNALGIISYEPGTQKFTLRSYALGYGGDFAMKLTSDGFTWDIPAGPMTIHYTGGHQRRHMA